MGIGVDLSIQNGVHVLKPTMNHLQNHHFCAGVNHPQMVGLLLGCHTAAVYKLDHVQTP
jgi:hypothetical protein